MSDIGIKTWITVEGVVNSMGHVIRASVVKVTVHKPTLDNDRQVAFPMHLKVDEEWFLKPTPQIEVQVPPPVAQAPVVVVPEGPVRGRAPSAAASVVRARP